MRTSISDWSKKTIKGVEYDFNSRSQVCYKNADFVGRLTDTLTNFDDLSEKECFKLINNQPYGYFIQPGPLSKKTPFYSIRKLVHPQFGPVEQALIKDLLDEPSWVNLDQNWQRLSF